MNYLPIDMLRGYLFFLFVGKLLGFLEAAFVI